MENENFKIGVIGAGGRTGTLFAFKLQKIGKVFAISKEKEAQKIKKGKIFIERGKEKKDLKIEVIEEKEFPKDENFDFLFLTIPNPVKKALSFYFKKIKEKNLKIPVLFLSQNGIEAGEEALSALKEIFGPKEFPVFRICLFNAVERKFEEDKIIISYSLPIRMAMAKVSGQISEKKIFKILKKADFEIYLVEKEKRKDMEYSKLFLNLIGMASATHSLSLFEGFSKKEIFQEEFLALREYLKVIKKAQGRLLNFPRYPLKWLSFLFYLPFWFLFPLRKILAKGIEKERRGKLKDLREIDYYNGAVVKLGKKLGIKTPFNEKILERAKLCLSKE